MKEFFKSGDLFIWMTGLGLGISLVMITGILYLIIINGSDYFWPQNIVKVETNDGRAYIGQKMTTEKIPLANMDDSLHSKGLKRIQFKVGNRELYGFDFLWLDESEIKNIHNNPKNALCFERMEFGNFFGYLENIYRDTTPIAKNQAKAMEILPNYLDIASNLRSEIKNIEKDEIGSINYKIEGLRTKIKKIEYENKHTKDHKIIEEKSKPFYAEIDSYQKGYTKLQVKIDSLNKIANTYSIKLTTAAGDTTNIPLINIFHYYSPNEMGFFGKLSFAFTKIYEFVFDEPRESNTEGGVFPAIFGTIMLVLLMSIAVVPFGVLAALYLREYAKQGFLVRTVRIAVNNLAGVPSIVFGIFGLGFFIYSVGGTIDKLFYPELLPTPTWGTGGILWASLTLALLTVPVVIVATEEALATIPRGIREASLALGATKWQTMKKIILPAAAPGILTGLILAMARAAGEVAPLMITGVVKLAPSLPLDLNLPFIHLDRKFMHLGFHIYDVGFQSPNIEAALPMVYMTTLLLIVIVILLNITAMKIRTNLRKKYKTSVF